MKLVVINTILASDEATPSREFSRPLKVSLPIPWKAKGSVRQSKMGFESNHHKTQSQKLNEFEHQPNPIYNTRQFKST